MKHHNHETLIHTKKLGKVKSQKRVVGRLESSRNNHYTESNNQ